MINHKCDDCGMTNESDVCYCGDCLRQYKNEIKDLEKQIDELESTIYKLTRGQVNV